MRNKKIIMSVAMFTSILCFSSSNIEVIAKTKENILQETKEKSYINNKERLLGLTDVSQFKQAYFNGEDFEVDLMDKYNIKHKFLFNFTAPNINPKSLGFEYKAPLNNKKYYFFIDTYVEKNGKVNLVDRTAWNLSGGVDPDSIGTFFYYTMENPEVIAAQEDLYLTFAFGDELNCTSYSAYKNIKISNGFSDWATNFGKKEILYAMDNNWIVKTNKFRPDAEITRAEFIKIINKSFGFRSKATSESFKDVDKSHWWYNEVLIAIKNGYLATTNENFRPQDPITREEVASIITTITKSKDTNLDKLNKYKDKNLVSSWALSSVEGTIEKGFMGKDSNMFNPKKYITRAEAIVTLYRINK